MPFIRRAGRPGLIGLAARTAVVAGTATAVSSGVNERRRRRAQEEDAARYEAAQEAAPTAPAPADGGTDLTAQLRQLGALHAQGILSDDEFSAAKTRLLG